MRVTRDKTLETAVDEADETSAVEALVDNLVEAESTAGYTPKYQGYRESTDEAVQAAMAELKAALNEPLDKTLLKQRKGYGKDENGNPKMLDYLEWHTVTRQLNRIFGPSNWEWKVDDIKTFGEDPDSGVPCVVTATATLIITWPNNEVTSYTNNGVEVIKRTQIYENHRPTGKYEPRTWEAFEMAFKGAAHDAFKRAATALGEQFGLSLYAKEEETKKARVEVVDGDAAATASTTASSASTTTTSTRAASTRRETPRQQPSTSKFATIAPEDYDADADDRVPCESCGDEIHGYFSERLNRVYTTADLVAISKRKTGGRTLCYNCQQSGR